MRYQRQVFERYLTEAEEKQLLSTVAKYADLEARRDHAWMRWMRQTGIRVTPASRFTCGDARQALREGYQTVRGATNKGGKTTKTRLNKRAQEALRDLLRVRREQGHAEHPDMPLVMSRKRQGLAVRSFQHRMRYWCELAGMDVQASPHWFRHTLAKRLMKRSTADNPLLIVQAVLDHSALTSTAVYTMPDREDIEQAMEEAS